MLDNLRRVKVCHQNLGAHTLIELTKPGSGLFTLGPDHNAVRVQKVVQRGALTQELGIARNLKFPLSISVAQDSALNPTGSMHWSRAFLDDQLVPVQVFRDGSGRTLDLGQVG